MKFESSPSHFNISLTIKDLFISNRMPIFVKNMHIMDNNQVEQPANVVPMESKRKPATRPAPKEGAALPQQQSAAAPENMYLISEKAINQLLNAIGELPGLTWKQTNPLIVFIQQNVKPATGQ